MMLSWTIAAVPFGIYSISQYLNIPLQIQPQLFLLLALITWAQIMYYDRRWSLNKCLLVMTGICIICAGIQAGAIFGIRVFTSSALHVMIGTSESRGKLACQDIRGSRRYRHCSWSSSAIYRYLQRTKSKRI